jgi:hypothetical protein
MENRIDQISVASTLERTAVKNDFGQMLARGVTSASSLLGGVASAILPGGAVISAAINRTASQSLSGGASKVVRSGSGNQLGGGYGTATSASSSGSGTSAEVIPTGGDDSLAQQREMMVQNQQWTAQYLTLQENMQQESREYNTVSNILKVRHESAKTAINNIR